MNAVAKQQRSAKKRRTADPVPSSAARPKKKSPLYNLPQNYYAPSQGAESMSAAELSEWRKEQRKKRNRESASISRNKNKLRLEKLEGERDHYKMRCKLLEDQMKGMQKRINLLEQAIAANGRLDVAIEASTDRQLCPDNSENQLIPVPLIVTSSNNPKLFPALLSTASSLPSVENQDNLVKEHILISRPAQSLC